MKMFIAGAILVVIVATVASLLLFIGPRMYDQEHLRSFQAVMQALPQGVVPISDPVPQVPTEEEARSLRNPLQATEANLARGKVYYEYYCVSCHGDRGDGNGPVGESYTPKPADLAAAKIQGYPDGRLLRAALTGVGHEPVLGRVVHPEHGWYLVLYTRHFARPPAASLAEVQPPPASE